jgi:teichuronic acid biosynthesis glycosyltransferase TuaG
MISVVIPVYNGELVVLRAIESVLAQTMQPSEIIIVDDCSSDNSYKILCGYARSQTTGPKFLVFQTSANVGPGGARNLGLAHASSEWIAFLDADDAWHPEKLEFQCVFSRTFPNVDFISHNSGVYDGERRTIPLFDADVVRIQFLELLFRNCIPTRSVFVRRNIMLKFPFSNREFAEDYLCWLKISKHGASMAHLPVELAYSFRDEYSKGGYSGNLTRHEIREIKSLSQFFNDRKRYIVMIAIIFSIVKYFRRLILRLLSEK